MIGAIVLTHRQRRDTRAAEDRAARSRRRPQEAIRNTKPGRRRRG